MSNTSLYFGPGLLDLIGGRYVAANQAMFDRSVVSDALGLEIAYQVGTPAFDLAPRTDGRNLTITVPVKVTVYDHGEGVRGKQLAAGDTSLTLAARLGLDAGMIGLTDLSSSAVGADFLSKVAAGMFQTQVLPAVANALADLPQPHLSELLGLPIRLLGLTVRGRLVWIDAAVDGLGAPPVLDPAHPPPGCTPTSIVCAISGEVVGHIADRRLPITKSKSDGHHLAGEGYRVSTWVSAASVRTAIVNGVASGQLTLAAGASGSIEVAWRHERLPGISFDIPAPALRLRIAEAGTSVAVGLDLTAPIRVTPSGVPHVARSALDSLASDVARDLTSAVGGQIETLFTAFVLPAATSAFGIVATLRFGWVGTHANALVAVVDVAA